MPMVIFEATIVAGTDLLLSEERGPHSLNEMTNQCERAARSYRNR
jgi:hypothetical protein